jgi:hypothetical protein
MKKKRREFLKKALVGTGAALAAGTALQAEETGEQPPGSNGVVIGHSPKKEILYRKTIHWREYYSVAP